MLRLVSETDTARVTAERLAQLQAATAKLAAALTVTDLSHALLSIAEETMRASAGVVYLIEPDGELRLQASRGAPAPSVERWRVLPRDAPVPLAAAIASGAPVFLGTRAEIASRYPATANNGMPASQLQSVAALPLIHGSRVLGGFAVTFDSERAFDEDERRWLTGIASQAAVAADRARLFDDLTKTLRLNELFVGVLAHDLRSPLAAIATAAELIRSRAGNPGGDSPADPHNAKALGRISTSSERMARMIEQLLDFTRLRVGSGLSLDTKPAELAPLVRQVAGEVADGSPSVTVMVEDVGDTGGTWDPDRLSQMLANLIGNAAQHGRPADGVRVLVDGMDTAVVRVRVHNMGAIPSELLPTLFDPLSAGERRRDRVRGLGLGLFIAKEIVAAHGGQLSVRSNDADGTTFTVSLPRSLEEAAAAAAAEPPRPSLPPQATTRAPPPAKHPTTNDERFRLLVEAVKDYAIFMLDPTGRVATWNTGAERIKGYKADEIIGQHFSRFYEQQEVDAGKCERELEMAAREGRFEDEGWRLRKDGTRFWANVVITAVRNPDGELVGFAKVTRDLTERRKLEEEQLRLTRARGGHPAARRVPVAGVTRAEDAAHGAAAAARQRWRRAWTRRTPKLAIKLQRASRSSERLARLVEACSTCRASRPAGSRWASSSSIWSKTPRSSSTRCAPWPRHGRQRALAGRPAPGRRHVGPAAARAGADQPAVQRHQVRRRRRHPGVGGPARRRGDAGGPRPRPRDSGVAHRAAVPALRARHRVAAQLRRTGSWAVSHRRRSSQAHGGSVAAENAEGGGARFRIRLPIVGAEAN